jgi:hypothetical protein
MGSALKLSTIDSTNFYRDIESFTQFSRVTDTKQHQEVPDDWDIIIADVIGSTNAIKAGRYKDVNLVGAACIAAITNVDKSVMIPFVFGGDGATFAAPSHMREKVKTALAGARAMAKSGFGLELRVGIVPVREVKELGQWVRVGKFQLSEYVAQPAFSGRGWEIAERMIKEPIKGRKYLVEDDWPSDGADFSGLACRWNSIPSVRDCKLSLLVVSTDADPERHSSQYAEIMDQIQKIFGSMEDIHPLKENLLSLSFNWSLLAKGATVHTSTAGIFAKIKYIVSTIFLNIIGTYLFARKLDTEATKWSNYKSDFVKNTDYKKFDGTLRMVIDAGFNQIDALTASLERMRSEGKIKYGMHRSREAIVTCLVEDYNGNHTHFVDGSDGGYAMAAVQLKAQLGERKS